MHEELCKIAVTWQQAVAPKGTRAAEALTTVATALGSAPAHAAKGAGMVVASPFRFAGNVVRGIAGQQAVSAVPSVGGIAASIGRDIGFLGKGAAKGMLGIAARAPMATALGAGALMMGGLVNNSSASSSKKLVSQAANQFMQKGASMKSGNNALRAQSDSFVKTASRPRVAIDNAGTRLIKEWYRKGIKAGAEAAELRAKEQAAKNAVPSIRQTFGPGGPGFRQAIGGAAALGTLGVGMSVGQAGMERAVDHLMDRAARGNTEAQWKAVLKVDPGLRREPGARRLFDMVNRASHYASSEPMLAAGAVRSLLAQARTTDDGAAPDLNMKMREVLDLERSRQQSRYPFRLEAGKTYKTDFLKGI